MDSLATSRYGSGRRGPMRQGSKGSGRAIPIPLEPLKPGSRMDPQERLFLEAAERGDKHTVARCLQGPNPVNVNCTNILGRSAIQIAVDNENTEIVELLLHQDGVKIGDALLYAIREGVYRIVEMLIDHPSITREMLGFEWAKTKICSGEQSSEYSPDISPVILAATCNQFEILQLLLSRGATIAKPHVLSCDCEKCIQQVNEDSLRHSLLRIHTFRALASPAWISLTSPDPILTAFKLSWELQHLAKRENEFKDTYNTLADSCKKYACDLLDQCRSSEEVIAVLNKESDEDEVPPPQEGGYDEKLSLSRLKLALKYEQKQFVSHPNCQQLLTGIWYEGLPGWRKRNVITKSFMCIMLIAMLPLFVLNYLIVPRSRVGQILRSPFMKFLYHSASFAAFLTMLLFASTEMVDDESRAFDRGPFPSELEWLIFIWVAGFVWAEVKQVWEEGCKAYIRQWWNWMDFIMLSLYLCSFSLRMVSWYQVHMTDAEPKELNRKDWPEYDPTLISEGLFAIANVFSFARIIFLFQANPHLGPLQISLGCMLIDIAKFLFIFFLVVISFACGLNQLYFYFNRTLKLERAARDNTTCAATKENPFLSLGTTLVTLFWSLFGLTNKNEVRMNLMGSDGVVKVFFTEGIGETLFIVYHAMAIIVLINMLIAMMSNSFLTIEDHADREWKFARSKLWMGYFDEGSTLPPPFNLIVSPKSIYYFFRGWKRLLCKCIRRNRRPKLRRKSTEGTIKRPSKGSNSASSAFGADQAVPGPPLYQDVMRRLVSRYIHQIKKQLRQDGVNEDDLLEIKQDISSLRYELREDRKRESARTTGHMDNLKRDILRSIHCIGGLPVNGITNGIHDGNTMPHSMSGNFLSQNEIETLKNEIVTSLRVEMRELVQEFAMNQHNMNSSPNHLPNILPPINSELYHTHLYTQL
ncbi:transient-receptor-potential-like protein isoform X2 [Lineus longissimus]|uniref:transient-receptor-potential-like protein isoform X2 n=1 Tax=Lineus longissimus TaxID=88925 RepID=UPI002B4C5DB0